MSFNKEKIQKQVNEIIIRNLCVAPSEINNPISLEDLSADELDIIEIVVDIEEFFGIEISDEEADNFVLVEDIYNIVENRLKEKEQ
jgi:acyl carrier protein